MPKRPSTSDKMRPFKKPKSLEEEIRELAKKIVNAAEQDKDSLVAALERQQTALERQQAAQQAELKQQQAKKAYEKAKAAFESIKKPGAEKENAKNVMDQAHAMYLALSGTYRFVSHAKLANSLSTASRLWTSWCSRYCHQLLSSNLLKPLSLQGAADVPSIESMVAQFTPVFATYQLYVDANPLVPIDFRFYPAERPAARNVFELLPLRETETISTTLVIVPSGFGKTSAAFEVGRNFFTLYMLCTPSEMGEARPYSGNNYNSSFADFLVALQQSLGAKPHNTVPQRTACTNEARNIASAYVSAHVFVLYLFMRTFPAATPYQFMRFQITELNPALICGVFSVLVKVLPDSLIKFANELHRAIVPLLDAYKQKKTCLFVSDELEGALNQMDEYFTSRDGSKQGRARGSITSSSRSKGQGDKFPLCNHGLRHRRGAGPNRFGRE